MIIKRALALQLGLICFAHISEGTKQCGSRECKKIANQMRNSLDMSADPCEDFYQFACGNWKSKNPRPDNQNSWNQFTKLSDKILAAAKNILKRFADL